MNVTPRRLITILSAMLTGVAGSLLALSLCGRMQYGLAVLLVLSAAAVGAAIVAALYARVADGKALRIDARVKRQHRLAEDLLAEFGDLTSETVELKGAVGLVQATLGEIRLEVARQAALSGILRDELEASGRSVRTDSYPQLEAFTDLRQLFQPLAPLPALGEASPPPDLMRAIVGQIAAHEPKVIVECGSGASTVWLGYAAKKYGAARVVSLEHDEHLARETRAQLQVHDLLDVVEVRHAPLESWALAGESWAWYSPAALSDLADIGLVLVDGPLPETHYPAAKLLLPRCADEASFILCDTDQNRVRQAAHRWLAEFRELSGHALPVERGAFLFRRIPM